MHWQTYFHCIHDHIHECILYSRLVQNCHESIWEKCQLSDRDQTTDPGSVCIVMFSSTVSECDMIEYHWLIIM